MMLHIAVPLIKPTLAVLTLYYAVARYNDFFNAMLYLGKSELQPLQMFLRRVLLMSSAEVLQSAGTAAMDAVRTAKRLGAERAIIAYRRTEDEMPARKAELHHAKAEGVEVMPLVAPLEFLKGEDGNVCGVRVQKMELGEPDESGRRRPVPIEGAIEEIPCDVAISAIGTNANPFAKKIGGMELNKWGYIVADEKTGRTSNPKIWAGGDIVTGAATVILAMGAGKAAAADMTKVLTGQE
jgi:glutamate synthase (NADPH/NADH) small chain